MNKYQAIMTIESYARFRNGLTKEDREMLIEAIEILKFDKGDEE